MKGTFSRFIAIAAIVALGVGLLSGLMAMPIDMRTTIDEYFDRQNMHDLRIVSPLGLTDDDVAAIAAYLPACRSRRRWWRRWSAYCPRSAVRFRR